MRYRWQTGFGEPMASSRRVTKGNDLAKAGETADKRLPPTSASENHPFGHISGENDLKSVFLP